MLTASNPKIKRLRRLARHRRQRDAEGVFVVEGPKLVELAQRAGWVEEVYAEPALASRFGADHVVADGVLDRALAAVTSQGVVAVARKRCDDEPAGDLVVVLVQVSDPGNAGTLVRTAQAVGATAVVFAAGSVDPFSPKCVRASAGSIFSVPVVEVGDPVQLLEGLGSRRVRRLGASAHAGAAYHDADLAAPFALVLGSEAHGLPVAIEAHLDEVVHIPMAPEVESLNVGVAGSVVLFEAARQRASR